MVKGKNITDTIKKTTKNTTKQINKTLKPIVSSVTFQIVFIIFIVVLLLVSTFSVYLYFLNKQRSNTMYINSDHYLINSKKFIEKDALPISTDHKYSFGAWISIDKNHYNTTKKNTEKQKYSHIMSFGEIKAHLDKNINISLNSGVWLDNEVNDFVIIYRTLNDGDDIIYDPNDENFNTKNVIRLNNILLNEWNLLMICVNTHSIQVYLNGKLIVSNVNENLLMSEPEYISVGYDENIYGVIRKIKFANFNLSENQQNILYNQGPNAFMLPDWKTYETDKKKDTVTSELINKAEKESVHVLDYGASIVTTIENKVKQLFNLI